MPELVDSSEEENDFREDSETLSSESESDDPDPDFVAAMQEAFARLRGLPNGEAFAAGTRRWWLQPLRDHYGASLRSQTGSESQPLDTVPIPAVPLLYPSAEWLTAIAAASASSVSPWSHVASAD